MSEILVWREKIQKFYGEYSIYIEKALQFLTALVTFLLINQNVGLMKSLATPMVAIVLSVICTILPPIFTVLVSTGLVLMHLSAISMGVMFVSALIFLIMFIFYCRFSPKNAWILVIVPLTYFLHIPYVIPVALGLYMTPVAAIPVAFGTIVFYMLSAVKNSFTAISSAGGMTGEVTLFLNMVFKNKELWVMTIAFILCISIVYFVRRLSIDHSWKIATAAGAVVNIVICVIGDLLFDIPISYGWLIFGNLLAILTGLVIEIFFFSVDYSRTEYLQYEDDDYYYYVKAVPKITISAPEKTVKRINKRVRTDKSDAGNKRPEDTDDISVLEYEKLNDSDTILLEKHLQEELDIQNIVQKELEE